MSRVLTVAFRLDDPTDGSMTIAMLERVSPGIRPFAYAWGDSLNERAHYREALEQIKAKLASTPVPQDAWVKELHGELFALANHALKA